MKYIPDVYMSFITFQRTATEKIGQNVPTEINNGTLSSLKAMPQKDLTSDGASSFAMARRQYTEVYPVIDQSINQKKKFIGGNRDASSVVARRRAVEVGVGTLNANKLPTSMMGVRDINDTSSALRRARAGGAYVPPKKTNHYAAAVDPRTFMFQ
jgi:hypothetical protein